MDLLVFDVVWQSLPSTPQSLCKHNICQHAVDSSLAWASSSTLCFSTFLTSLSLQALSNVRLKYSYLDGAVGSIFSIMRSWRCILLRSFTFLSAWGHVQYNRRNTNGFCAMAKYHSLIQWSLTWDPPIMDESWTHDMVQRSSITFQEDVGKPRVSRLLQLHTISTILGHATSAGNPQVVTGYLQKNTCRSCTCRSGSTCSHRSQQIQVSVLILAIPAGQTCIDLYTKLCSWKL